MTFMGAAVGRWFPKGRPQTVTEGLLAVRRQLDKDRPLPDFLIVGAQRCGTSSLYKYLEAHPLVVPSLRKETHYFSHHHAKGEAWYRSHFPSRAYRTVVRRRHRREPLTFEATPAYLFHPWAAERAADLVSEAQIVVLLRNPVDRAFSHYHHSVRRGWEELPFEQAVAVEPERLAGHVERMASDPSYRSNDFLRYSYLARGFYADQLERWATHFPRERIHVLRTEDLFDRSMETYHGLLTFLGLPPSSPPELANHSYRGSSRPQGAPMPASVRDTLIEIFAPHNRRLSLFLGRDLGWDE